MKNDVLVSVAGVQLSLEGEKPVEIISKGKYYKRKNKIYIKYDEVSEDNDVSECRIVVSDNCVEITKKGAITSCMVFEKDNNCMSTYGTPFGNLMVGITTNELIILEGEDSLNIKISYMLDVNYSFVSECSVDIKVFSVAV